MRNYATPHCHIKSLDSASTPANFVKRELELETGGLVVTDHGTLIACQEVYELGKKHGLIPVLGIEGYMRDDNCPIFKEAGIPKNSDGTYSDHFKYGHFCAHFLDQEAYTTCIRLLSKAPTEQHGSEVKPLFNWQDMEELGATNTTITSGCLIGVVGRHLLKNNDPATAEAYYKRLRSIVKPGNFIVEAFPNLCTHNYVKGIFVTIKQPNGDVANLRFWEGKTLKTNASELKANSLAAAFGGKENKHTHLVAVKDRGVWVDQEPAEIISIEHKDGFFENECTDWATDGDVQLGVNKFVVELAKKYGDPVQISDDAHHSTFDEKIVQNVRLAASGWNPFFGSYHRKSSAEAWEYFKTRMGVDEKTFEGWIDNSHAWLTRFKDFKLEAKPSLPTKFYEEKYADVGATNSLEYTLHLIKKHGRFVEKPEYRARLNAELKLLYKNGVIDLLPYFMIGESVCDLYTQNKMLTGSGRGSAAGLLLAYYLGITHVDPIRYGLSLDRFLTLDRIKSGKLPDIDQDLGSRDLLVGDDGSGGWLKERFGDHVAQISTVTTLRLSSSVKDVARFQLGAVPKDIADMAHKFMKPPQGLEDHKFVFGYKDSGNPVPGSITFDQTLIKYANTYPEQWDITQKVLGLGRGVSRHACAYAFSNQPIGSFIPLTKIGGVTCTQFTAAAVEAAGALKMDFLVINSLNDISNAILMAQERCGVPLPHPKGCILNGKYVPNIRLIPLPGASKLWEEASLHGAESAVEPEELWGDIWDLVEDQDVFGDIAQGKTETVFQLNTPSAVQWLRHFAHKSDNGKYAINSIEGLAAFTALDRPGPLDAKVTDPDAVNEDGNLSKHNMLVEYARRARGANPSRDIHPIMDKLFPETFGVLTFQEQHQRAYQELTECTGPEAEEFRSNCAKKKMEKVLAAYPFFIERATIKLGSKEAAEAVWETMKTFAEYSFNKCLSGDTIVVRAGSNRHQGPEISIRDLYEAQRSDTPWGVKIRAGRLNILQMSDDGRVRPGSLKEIHYNGQKTVFEILLEDGKSVKATGNHRFLTPGGYRKVEQLSVGDSLVVVGKVPVRPNAMNTRRAIGKHYDGHGMPNGEENPSWIDGRTALLKEAKEGVFARSRGRCEICGISPHKSAHSLEFAHTNSLEECSGDYEAYHNSENARMLCNSCHKKFDYQKGERKVRWTKGLPTEPSKIMSISEVGVEDTYDLEMATVAHNFMANGIVSHNSHAVCYVVIAYACAYLKHHYGLEWWTAVLRNAKKEEINEKFWKHCGHLINLPDVTSPCKGFEIVSERIQAPLSLLLGIGPAAHAELVAGAPYASMDDFVKRINDKKQAGATMVTVVDKKTGEKKEKRVLGRSALHSGIVDKLIISGAMDKLFPEGEPTLSMLEGYRQSTFEAEQAARKKPSKTKVRKNVPKEFLNLTQLTRYQLRKQILPAYSESVLKILLQRKHESTYLDGGRPRLRWGSRGTPLVTHAQMDKISKGVLPEHGLRVAIAVYVTAVRVFEFGPKNAQGVRENPKKACEMVVDLDGTTTKFVKWADFQTEVLDPRFNESLKDSIVVLVISKFKENKPFGIDDIEVIQPAPGEVQPDPEPEESPSNE